MRRPVAPRPKSAAVLAPALVVVEARLISARHAAGKTGLTAVSSRQLKQTLLEATRQVLRESPQLVHIEAVAASVPETLLRLPVAKDVLPQFAHTEGEESVSLALQAARPVVLLDQAALRQLIRPTPVRSPCQDKARQILSAETAVPLYKIVLVGLIGPPATALLDAVAKAAVPTRLRPVAEEVAVLLMAVQVTLRLMVTPGVAKTSRPDVRLGARPKAAIPTNAVRLGPQPCPSRLKLVPLRLPLYALTRLTIAAVWPAAGT